MIFLTFRQGFSGFDGGQGGIVRDMNESNIGDPPVAEHLIDPLQNYIFLISQQGRIGAGNRDIKPGFRRGFLILGLPVMDFQGLRLGGHLRPHNVLPMRDHPPQRDKLAGEGLVRDFRHGLG